MFEAKVTKRRDGNEMRTVNRKNEIYKLGNNSFNKQKIRNTIQRKRFFVSYCRRTVIKDNIFGKLIN